MRATWAGAALLGLTGCVGDWCDRFGLDCVESPPEREVVDADGDVWVASEDCDDNDPEVHPGASEICDGVDNNCDGQIDEGTPGEYPWYPDRDQDGYGDMTASPVMSCDTPPRYVQDDSDCDDNDWGIHPDQVEICDGIDNDCDGLIDDEDDSTAYATSDPYAWPDADGDGWGDAVEGPHHVCELSAGLVDQGDDCDDTDPEVHPGVVEIWYDAIDQDCDGHDDFDADWDGYLATDGDCDDTDPQVHPDANEVCNGVDDDCDGVADACLELADMAWFIDSESVGSETGAAVATGGDLDGDGLDDLLVGAPGQARGWLVTGPITSDTDLSTSSRISLDRAGATLGASLLALRDVDGDDYDDMVIADTTTSLRWRDGGAVWLIHGPVTASLTLTEDDMWFPGAWKGRLGSQMATGDVNGDALPDVVIGEPDQTYDDGRAFVILGPLTGDRIELTKSDTDLEHLGETVATGGDLTGDGIDDIVLGASTVYDSSSGPYHPQAFILEGPVTGNLDVAAALANVQVEDGADHRTISVAIASDLDGDSLDDLVLSFPRNSSSGSSVRVLSGAPTGQVLVDDVAVATIRITPYYDYYYISGHHAVLGAGDLDGDGFGELLVSDPYQGSDQEGAVGLFAGPLSGTLDIDQDSVAVTSDTPEANIGQSMAIGGGVLPDGDALFIGAPGSGAGGVWGLPMAALE